MSGGKMDIDMFADVSNKLDIMELQQRECVEHMFSSLVALANSRYKNLDDDRLYCIMSYGAGFIQHIFKVMEDPKPFMKELEDLESIKKEPT